MRSKLVFQALHDLKQGTAVRVAHYVSDSMKYDISPLETHEVLRHLEDKGLVISTMVGTRKHYRLTAEGHGLAKDEGWLLA